MSKIKSALELALEKTENITIDKEALQKKEMENMGKRLASSIIKGEKVNLEKELKETESPDPLRKGLLETLMSYIRFTDTELQKNNLKKVENCFITVGENKNELETLFEHLTQFSEKRIEDMTNLLKALEQQYAPTLDQKKQKLAQQTGRAVDLNALDDPDFQKLYSEHREQLSAQYDQVMAQIKDQFKEYLGL